jgi:hypothetical protein
MKKNFKLKVENKHPDRLLESIKYEIRKYIKREKNKKLPEDVDFWKFDCKFAKNEEEPQVIDFVDITKNIDEASTLGCDSFYMEILSTKGYRVKKEEQKEEIIEDSEIAENTED